MQAQEFSIYNKGVLGKTHFPGVARGFGFYVLTELKKEKLCEPGRFQKASLCKSNGGNFMPTNPQG